MMNKKDDPKNEGHTREWQDRARVVLDAKKAAGTEASPNQSPVSGAEKREKSEQKNGDPDKNASRDPGAVY